MNYLAHLFFSDGSEESLLGSMLGDFFKQNMDRQYGETVMKWIHLHWKIDKFTDSHPVFRQSRERAEKTIYRFSGIFIDIIYDHFLAKNWDKYSSLSLGDFSRYFYSVLNTNYSRLPERLKQLSKYMINQDWLTSYAGLDGIKATFDRLCHRIRVAHNLDKGIDELKKNYIHYEEDFSVFFGQLRRFVESEILNDTD
ncbi:MAG: DUF479 domain-containing protein [Spirochaetales bacterium]|nr:DUF479 domain-containing protein [Spirochaetales bacterium]